jgi:signal transduction histidine kinase
MKSLFLDQARQKGLSIKIQADSAAQRIMHHSDVYLDRDRISQVLSNLIQNSIKYSHHGNILIKVGFVQEEATEEAQALASHEPEEAKELNLFQLSSPDCYASAGKS